MPLAAVAGIGAVGSIISGVSGASAAKKASAVQAQKEQQAIDFTKQQAADAKNYQVGATNEQRQNITPWINTGQSANSRLAYLMGLPAPPSGAPVGGPAPATAAALNPGQPQILPPQRGIGPTGPMTPAYAHGGVIQGPGTGTSDSVPIRASAGEGVLTAAAMKIPGVENMVMHLNRMTTGKAPKVGGSHFALGGLVTPPGPTGVMTPSPPSGQPTANGNAASLSTVDPTTISDPTLRTIIGASQGGVNMNSLPGGQTSWNEQPGLMKSLNIGPNGQMQPGTAGAGSSPAGDAAGMFGSLTQPFGESFSAPTLNDTTDPGYAARLKLGQDAIERSAAARGGLLSGGTAKALSDYGQNFASQEYGNVYDRAHQQFMDRYGIFRNQQSDLYSRLMGISGAGQQGAMNFNSNLQSGAGNVAGIDMGAAGQVGQDLGNQGAALGSGYIGAQNAYNGMIGGITNAASLYGLLRGNAGYPGSGPTGGN